MKAILQCIAGYLVGLLEPLAPLHTARIVHWKLAPNVKSRLQEFDQLQWSAIVAEKRACELRVCIASIYNGKAIRSSVIYCSVYCVQLPLFYRHMLTRASYQLLIN